jgi:LAO/AO transport system kinase
VKPFFVYMLRDADGSYYVGHTDDLERRLAQHQAGEMPDSWTHARRPLAHVWSGEASTREEALAFEQRIKGWSRAKKEALIEGDWQRVSALAKTRGGLRRAQPERNPNPARPELVEGPAAHAGLRQAQPERSPNPVRPEPAEGLSKDILETGPRQRRAVAKAITLLESTRADHRARADALLTALLPHTGKSLRLGISGVPGVGKSTFIEALGLRLIERGHRVAVLAVDPSSSLSGGSILGDKTRMARLAVQAHAYIRPSPAAGTLGGVAAKTREAMLVCEAAGHDVVIVETVGVGQSESAVAGMTDMFVLLQLPNAGDELQALKKGVVELADLIVINKADLDAAAATRAEAHIRSALRLLNPRARAEAVAPEAAPWQPQVMALSALTGAGVDAFWAQVDAFAALQRGSGRFAQRRRRQAEAWMWDLIHTGLRERFLQHPAVRAALQATTARVAAGELPASAAARALLACFGGATHEH